MNNKIAIIIVLLFNIAFVSIAYILMGKIPAIIFSVASVGGLVLWLFTTYKTPIDPFKVIIPYLVTVIFFILHVYEEYLTDFEIAITDIFGFHVPEENFLTVAAFLAPAM